MRRKVIKQGNNTLTITLPRSWVEERKIEAGDELEVNVQGPSITLSTQNYAKATKAVVDITPLGTFSTRILASLYRKGYDEVDVRFTQPGQSRAVQEIISGRLLGFEVVAQGKNYCTIKNISTPLDQEFDTILKRTFLLLVSMGDDCLDAIKKKDMQALGDVRSMEMVNNKFTSFCRRILNLKGYQDYKKTPAMYSILEEMEKIADEYKYLIDFILTRPSITVSKELLSLFEQVNAIVESFYHLFYDYKAEDGVTFWNERKKLVDKLVKHLHSGKGDETVVAHHLLNLTDLTFDMLDPLLVMVL